MRLPARQAPTSLAGQLRFIQATWGIFLGDSLEALIRRLDLAIGVLAEEERALHLRFGGGGDGGGGAGRRTEGPTFGPAAADEPEAFSSDSAWMPRVVLIAKSTYVWLDQLSRSHERDIRTLDAIPDEELDELARWGVTGPVADRPVGAVECVGADQADARQRRRGRLGVFARRLPDRDRSRRRGGLRRPARPGLGARDPAGQRHGPQPHGHRLELGHRASRVVPVARRTALPGLLVHRTGPVDR